MASQNIGGDWIYRAMVEENGRPRIGATALTLGIRPGHDIEVDTNGLVHRPAFQSGGKNGLSCAPAIHLLPPFALPLRFGGFNKRSAVWRIKKSALGTDLEAQQDSPRHISIGPARTVPPADYVVAIERTAPYWVRQT